MSARGEHPSAPGALPAIDEPPTSDAPSDADGWRRVARRRELRAGQPHAVVLDDERLVLVADEGTVAALVDRCTHQAFPLSEGDVVDGTIMCAWHGARFDLRTGACVAAPIGSDACGAVRTFATRVVGDEVWVKVE